MEDERSLLGSRLDVALPARIADCEVFIQVVTETSANSAWVAREFEWATSDHAGHTRPPVVLPVAVDGARVPDRVASWVYLSVNTPIDLASLEVIRAVAMRAVVPLPLDPDAPYQLAERELVEYCGSNLEEQRRVVLDSGGLVPNLVRETARFVAGLTESHGDKVLAALTQQVRSHQRLKRYLSILDALIPDVARRVQPLAQTHWDLKDWLTEMVRIMQRIVKLTLGRIVLDLIEQWGISLEGSLAPSTRDRCTAAVAKTKELQEIMKNHGGAGQFFWALDASPGQRWLDLGFDADHVDGVHVRLPADHFDEIGILALRSGDRPAHEVTGADWLTIGLPQVIARIVPTAVSDVPGVLERVGWSITDYDRSGPH
ncbi:hypothetical protein DV20_38410 [Amycolatopsis rifamycinica]|uniref:TIR domain-containing protein n=2 Tax=Amycolatopsis rifamycinica TaxID=287986 RepID=A0A066TQ41_9PSEU|nr:hypothetical protein DV20_38410 [Amycolatopsis rifamycinica]